jgi:hypothetical protein
MLLVKFEWREATIARYVEPVGHFLSIFLPLANGSLGVAKDYLKPMEILPGFCWFWEYPPGCFEDDNCNRGDTNARDKDNVTNHANMTLFVVVFGTIIISMFFIILKVRKIELRIKRYDGSRSNQIERTKETGTQALLHIAAFF